MHEEDIKGFDLQIRSMVEDAEVRPSRRVRKAVLARMVPDTAPQAGPYRPWMSWSACALAVCAALAVGIFHKSKPIPTYIINNDPKELLAQEVPQVLPEPASPEAISAAGKAGILPERYKDVSVGEIASFAVPEKQEEETPSAPESADVQIPVNTVTDGDREEEKADGEFIDWGSEEKAAGMPRDFYLRGSVTGNSSGAKVSGSRYVSGGGSSVTGIKETGKSSYSIPFTAGLGVRVHVLPRLAIGTGLNYSYLTRNFEGVYTHVNDAGVIDVKASGDIKHTMHYIGIPVNLYFDIAGGDKFKFYVYGGGSAEYCLSSKYDIHTTTLGNFTHKDKVNNLQWSAGIGLGVEFKAVKGLGIYLDPGVRYYFENGQPRNLRTDKPFLINLDAGIRWDF